MNMQKKILIVDDDPAILDAMSLVLEDASYQVIPLDKGDVLVAVLQYTPDLILLDLWMSGQNGYEICKLLKANPKTKHIPILLVSANKDTGKITREAGAEDYLEKPFDICDLLSKIKRYLA